MQIDLSTILITGGSSGLGAACAEMLAKRGARVVIADLAPPRNGVTSEFADRVLFKQTDVTSEADVRAAILAGEERFGPLRGVSPARVYCTPSVCWDEAALHRWKSFAG